MCVFADEFLEEIQRLVESKLSTVSREITDSRVKTQEELDVLYRKIITYILLRSGMGSPSDVSTVQEATGLTLTHSFTVGSHNVSDLCGQLERYHADQQAILHGQMFVLEMNNINQD